MNENDSTTPTDDEPVAERTEQPHAEASGIGKARWILRGLLLSACAGSFVLMATPGGAPPAAQDPVTITIIPAEDYGSAKVVLHDSADPVQSDDEILEMLKSPPDTVLLRVAGGVYQHEVDRVRSVITNAAPGTQIQLQLLTEPDKIQSD